MKMAPAAIGGKSVTTKTQRRSTRKQKARDKAKKKALKRVLANLGAETGEIVRPAPERLARGEIISGHALVNDQNVKVLRHFQSNRECQLDIYLERWNKHADRNYSGKELLDILEENRRLHAAGLKLREAFQFSAQNIQTHDIVMAGTEAVGGGDRNHSISRAKIIERQAFEAVTGVRQKMLRKVCCYDEPAGGTRAIETLKRALKALSILSPWPDMKRASEAWVAKVTRYENGEMRLEDGRRILPLKSS